MGVRLQPDRSLPIGELSLLAERDQMANQVRDLTAQVATLKREITAHEARELALAKRIVALEFRIGDASKKRGARR